MLPVHDIAPLLPQSSPFIMVSKLLNMEAGKTTTSFIIEESNVLVCQGVFTEAGLLENIAQTAAAGAGYHASLKNKPVQKGYIGAVKNFIIFALPKVNDEITTEIEETGVVFNMQTIQGKVWLEEKLLAQCEMRIFLQAEED